MPLAGSDVADVRTQVAGQVRSEDHANNEQLGITHPQIQFLDLQPEQ